MVALPGIEPEPHDYQSCPLPLRYRALVVCDIRAQAQRSIMSTHLLPQSRQNGTQGGTRTHGLFRVEEMALPLAVT